MNAQIPTCADIRALLQPYSQAELLELAELSKVPFKTVLKIRYGSTVNPTLNTVVTLYPTLLDFKPSKQKA